MVNIINSDLITVGDAYSVITGESYFLTPGTLVGSTSASGFIGGSISSSDFLIAGTVFSEFSAIELNSNSSENTVSITATGIVAADSGIGVWLRGSGNSISNDGSVTSTRSYGLSIDGDNGIITNSGTVTATDPDNFFSYAIFFTGDNAQLFNTGVIQSNSLSNAAVQINSVAGETSYTSNFGSISGGSGVAYQSEAGDDTVINGGIIQGGVNLNDGDDIYRGVGDGVATGLVQGELGEDLLIGGALGDQFDGGEDDDMLRGKGGDDELHGDEGDDTIIGGTGEDALLGGTGEDTLRGGDDNDILVGGLDQDILFGDAGADAFVYVDALDSTDDANRDLIRDFTNGEDVIDLSAFAGAFTFIGSSGFSGTGGGEVRFIVNAGGNAVVRVDVDGDGLTDMRILVQGTDTLTENDFFL